MAKACLASGLPKKALSEWLSRGEEVLHRPSEPEVTSIVKQLRTVLGPGASDRFYGDEDGHSQAAWSLFRSEMKQSDGKDLEPICATAVAIFAACLAWFSQPLPAAGGR